MTAARPPLYEVLRVDPSVTQLELKRAYRRKQHSAHPDTGGSAEQFHAVQAAWAIRGSRVGALSTTAHSKRK
ncbi:J domain-containing protein [Homoserinimonas sp. OAct 916]|uniref:J domain-containing protein n=1 Tax=Homoserinimonas sp. OAct 916 TaxID=2211450 RepID=UPI000DBE60B1